MLSFSGGLKVFVALEPVDLRKSFSGLEGLVSTRLGEDLRQGALLFTCSKLNLERHAPVRSCDKHNDRASAGPCWRDCTAPSCG